MEIQIAYFFLSEDNSWEDSSTLGQFFYYKSVSIVFHEKNNLFDISKEKSEYTFKDAFPAILRPTFLLLQFLTDLKYPIKSTAAGYKARPCYIKIHYTKNKRRLLSIDCQFSSISASSSVLTVPEISL